MKAVAFANNDVAVVAWTFGGKIPGCLGFAVYRIDVRAGTETCLPAMATFPDQDASKPGRTTADDPVQKFFWKDVYAKRGGTYRYRIVAMGGTQASPKPIKDVAPLVTEPVTSTPHLRGVDAYFNRGILSTQALARSLTAAGGVNVNVLQAAIKSADNEIRHDL